MQQIGLQIEKQTTPNPQKLLLFLLNHDFSKQQCFSTTQSQNKKQKLDKEISYMRNKLSDIIKTNQKVIKLMQQRDQRTVRLQKLVGERTRIEVKVGLDGFRQKYKTQREENLSGRGIKAQMLAIDKKTTMKDNLRSYKVTNRQFRTKINDLKLQCERLEKSNKILFEQQQVNQAVNSLSEQVRNRTDFVTNTTFHLESHAPQYFDGQSNMWINKIEKIKRDYLTPTQQREKLQLINEAKDSLKQTSKSRRQSFLGVKNSNIYSDRFWFRKMTDNQDNLNRKFINKENSNIGKSVSPARSDKSKERGVYFCQRIKKTSQQNQRKNNFSDRSDHTLLNRVKSLESLQFDKDTSHSTCRSNLYSYRRIYR